MSMNIGWALVIVAMSACTPRDGKPHGPFHMRSTPRQVTVKPVVADGSPISVALSPDATRFAYTTGGGELFVYAFAGSVAKPWTVQIDGALARYVAGFFTDGSLALLSTTVTNEWRLHRITEAGGATLLHTSPSRLYAAVSNDRTIIATETTISEVTPNGERQIAKVGDGALIRAIAISPDGTRIATMRDPVHEATEQIHVTTMAGVELGAQQRFGSSPGHGHELLAWIDNERFVYAGGDAENEGHGVQIYAEGLEDGMPETRDVWPVDAYVGLGSAANGTLLVVRGTIAQTVQLAGDRPWPLAPAGNDARRVIGWTRDDRPVLATGFWRDERILRGNEPWPGTKPGDAGDAIVGDAVILHRMGDSGLAVERLDAKGARVTLSHVAMANARWRPQLVRCAGESAAPCMIEHAEYDSTSWVAFDPVSGKRGETLYAHPVVLTTGPTPNAALSLDGKTLAVVDETATITIVAGKQPHATTIAGVGAFDSITFATSDAMWASARHVRGRPFAVVRLVLDRKTMQVRLDETSLVADDSMRVYMRPTASRGGKRLAIGVRELRTEIARVSGL
jgi:hypothetical protein